jgi:hypothetical protein
MCVCVFVFVREVGFKISFDRIATTTASKALQNSTPYVIATKEVHMLLIIYLRVN